MANKHDPYPDRLFHYTMADFARDVTTDMDAGLEIEITIWESGLYGEGFYLLDLAPDGADAEVLRYECFADGRDHPMDGVVVLDPGMLGDEVEFVERHIWMVPAPIPTAIPVSSAIVAVGIREGDEWKYEEFG